MRRSSSQLVDSSHFIPSQELLRKRFNLSKEVDIFEKMYQRGDSIESVTDNRQRRLDLISPWVVRFVKKISCLYI